jgi:hypothetical protein
MALTPYPHLRGMSSLPGQFMLNFVSGKIELSISPQTAFV